MTALCSTAPQTRQRGAQKRCLKRYDARQRFSRPTPRIQKERIKSFWRKAAAVSRVRQPL